MKVNNSNEALVVRFSLSEIIGTDKGYFKTPATDTLVNLPKGADVYKSEQSFSISTDLKTEL